MHHVIEVVFRNEAQSGHTIVEDSLLDGRDFLEGSAKAVPLRYFQIDFDVFPAVRYWLGRCHGNHEIISTTFWYQAGWYGPKFSFLSDEK